MQPKIVDSCVSVLDCHNKVLANIVSFIYLLQVCCRHLSQDTVTLKQACVVSLRTSRVIMLTGKGGEDPPRPHTQGPEGTTPLDSVRVSLTLTLLPETVHNNLLACFKEY